MARSSPRNSTSLEELKHRDPDASVNTGILRLHRPQVHTPVLSPDASDGDYEPTSQSPKACSNPDPLEEIRELPLGALDLGWYLLADAALDLGRTRSFLDIRGRLADGPILRLEVGRQRKIAHHLVTGRDIGPLASVLPE